LLPKQWRKDVAEVSSDVELARIVSDYIAGMTARFALQEAEHLTGRKPIPAGRRATPIQHHD
jgi:dGTPase